MSELSPQAQGTHAAESLRRLIFRRFTKNRVAVVSALVLIGLYAAMIGAEFFAPYGMSQVHRDFLFAPPHRVRFVDQEGNFHLRPFVYRKEGRRDLMTLQYVYEDNVEVIDPIYFFVRGTPYRWLGLIETDLHFFGTEEGEIFLLGTDRRGRDMLSRIIYGSRVSLTAGLLGVALTVLLGTVLGTISGYLGGVVDEVIQRLIELLRSFPELPLWMALSAAVPPYWSSLYVYMGIVTVLALVGWTGLAREVRGMVLSLRQSDYVVAAQALGAGTPRVLGRHIIPSMASHILVIATLGIPVTIIGESALSFLGLGIKAPLTSWGLLLQEAQRVEVLRLQPWMLYPSVFIIVAVLAFNFVGDGVRDAVDPYSK